MYSIGVTCWTLYSIGVTCWTLYSTAVACWILYSTDVTCWTLYSIGVTCWTLYSTDVTCWTLYSTAVAWFNVCLHKQWTCLFFTSWKYCSGWCRIIISNSLHCFIRRVFVIKGCSFFRETGILSKLSAAVAATGYKAYVLVPSRWVGLSVSFVIHQLSFCWLKFIRSLICVCVHH